MASVAEKYGFESFETSAHEGWNVVSAFHSLVYHIFESSIEKLAKLGREIEEDKQPSKAHID